METENNKNEKSISDKVLEKIQEKNQDYQATFKEALTSYKKGEFDVAKNLLIKITVVEETKNERGAGFWARLSRMMGGATMAERAEDLLEKIKTKEERAQIERQKTGELKIKIEGDKKGRFRKLLG